MLREAGGFEMVEKVIGYCDEERRMNFMGEDPCVESYLVLLEEGVCYDQCVLLVKLY